MNAEATFCRIALPVPVPGLFDYRWTLAKPPLPGTRVLVPFGNRKLVGVLMELGPPSLDPAKIKPVTRLIEPDLRVPLHLLDLARWASSYYCYPIGEVVATMLPAALRSIDRPEPRPSWLWHLSDSGKAIEPGSLKRAPRQRDALEALKSGPLGTQSLSSMEIGSDIMRRLESKGWVERLQESAAPGPPAESGPPLTPAQTSAIAQVRSHRDHFAPLLLEGVTGSGKTEIYLAAIEDVLARGQQALVIVPEIGLTPQLAERFRRRLPGRLAVVHSGLGDPERGQTWVDAAQGNLDVAVGTRSAVFTPLANPGIIVVDEEHDLSFKQHDGFRYSARDLAVQRAKMLDIPVLLGSATPSLETIHNAELGRYAHASLPRRPGAARMPDVRLIDVRGHLPESGLSNPMMQTLKAHLGRGQQALVFLNRRGFSPVLICNACGWTAMCHRCDSRMTLHRFDRQLRCHHCGHDQRPPELCPDCGSSRLIPLGVGTERLEELLVQIFPDVPVRRIDRDSLRGRSAFSNMISQVLTGEPCILVGTQMLAKGHDFPGVTLVCVVNIDQALFSSDFRATERSAQLLVQVAGRAGRGSIPGEVLVQTHHPDHPLFKQVLQQGYGRYARDLLSERRAAAFPPFGGMALLRAEASQRKEADSFLEAALDCVKPPSEVQFFGPMPAPMERRAGRYRMQLLVMSPSRSLLHRYLRTWTRHLYTLKQARRARWSLDIDPQDSF